MDEVITSFIINTSTKFIEITGQEVRDHTLQVVSEKAEMMLFLLKDFKERILDPHP